MQAGCAKMAERIDVQFGVKTAGDQETLYYMGVPVPRRRGKGLIFDLASEFLSTAAKSSFAIAKEINSASTAFDSLSRSPV